MLEVYHRYQQYRELLGQELGQAYLEDQCPDGCPPGSHCSYGLCFCDSGKEQVPVNIFSAMKFPSRHKIKMNSRG